MQTSYGPNKETETAAHLRKHQLARHTHVAHSSDFYTLSLPLAWSCLESSFCLASPYCPCWLVATLALLPPVVDSAALPEAAAFAAAPWR